MASLINKYFSIVFIREDIVNRPVAEIRKNCYQPDKIVETLGDLDITQDKVRRALKSLKENKAAGGGMDLTLAI
jgi:hypothetical protein